MADICVIAVKLRTSLKVKLGGARGLQGRPAGAWDSEVSYGIGATVSRQKASIWYHWISKTDPNLDNDPATDDGTNWAQGNVITVLGIQFDVSETAPDHSEGQIHWNDDDKSLDIDSEVTGVSAQLPQEVWARATNKSGAELGDGTPVYQDGSQGKRPTVAKALANGGITDDVLGLMTHDLADNDTGYATMFGLVRDIDTTGTPVSEVWANGNKLYLSDTAAGQLTKTKPTPPNVSYIVASVVYAHATEGILFVRVRLDPTQFLQHTGGTLTAYRETSAANQAGISGSVTFNYENGNIHPFTFGGDITDLTLSDLPSTGDLVLVLYPKQDAGGNAWDVTWTLDAGSVDWGDAGAPDLSDAANKVDEVVLRRASGGTVWRGTYTKGFGS